ncbi:MAG TPA: phosphatase PAP2 family protein [Pseudolysinimonas sp.]|jgi:undecaprenyl-diphosphatase
MADSIVSRRRSPRRVAELATGAGGVLLVVLGGVLLARLVHDAPLGLDSTWARAMTADRTAQGVAMATALATIGGTLVTSLLTVAVGATLLILRQWRTAIVLIVTVALTSGASSLMKVLVARPRPPGGLLTLSSLSYPSGHATTAAALVAVLVMALPRVWTWALGVVWVLVIAWSRTYLGVHWLTDVAAGAVLGASIALLVHGAVALVGVNDEVNGPSRMA